MQNSTLPSKVIEYCQRCSKREGVAMIAYCCYLSFADRTIKATEVDTVNAIADQFGISPAKTVWIGRKVRQGSLKIKRPKSTDARKLLFFLSLMLAGTDFEIDEREEDAIKSLAQQLKIPAKTTAEQIAKFKKNRSAQPITKINPPEQEWPQHASTSTATFSRMNQTFSQNFVNNKWEADLFQEPYQANAEATAELEFTPLQTNSPVLELSFFETALSTSGDLTILIDNRFIGEVETKSGESEYLINLDPAAEWGSLIPGAEVTVNLDGLTILKGEFQLD
jgi:hypothetical protein